MASSDISLTGICGLHVKLCLQTVWKFSWADAVVSSRCLSLMLVEDRTHPVLAFDFNSCAQTLVIVRIFRWCYVLWMGGIFKLCNFTLRTIFLQLLVFRHSFSQIGASDVKPVPNLSWGSLLCGDLKQGAAETEVYITDLLSIYLISCQILLHLFLIFTSSNFFEMCCCH